MKLREKKPETVYRIIDRETGNAQPSYSRAYCDEFDFISPEDARNANCHGMFKDKNKFKIAKYKVTYELIEDDVDGGVLVAHRLVARLEVDDLQAGVAQRAPARWRAVTGAPIRTPMS